MKQQEKERIEFIRGYCERSGCTEEFFHRCRVALPCDPEKSDGNKWAAIPYDISSIADHMEFYAPNPIEWLEAQLR